ncbi:hypothetical protein KAFR_0J00550 [Kazachstania africana CBS 2517]|uniref:BUB1 N-terminal domain-containing protein n=1 Tax=Kazachstania africana (strain ATCC 22294 / BCRC 22015 / CBS 2517 / CECT 1963 / NBRC 1671 / NRRL Y-8276) TaxID=1071382 RepID=H2B0H3_KAZAF|nr:hypothetical protein KAFR_0J00550 [Kazachstania africana CBS 2517]CCF60123.1 hypothetical protein KAFR_0J00550 [Kazachstania africana CBS 2517]
MDNMVEKGVVDFSDIEVEKENVLPLRKGRSAKRLVNVLKQRDSELEVTRASFERRLETELSTLDDPLCLFLEYMDWLHIAYPQGGNSKGSNMLHVMERCLMHCKALECYTNDPRYLTLWLNYIELFYRDSYYESKDIFVFLYRNKIGGQLSMFYEEFSNLLCEMNRYNEACYILNDGIQRGAAPTDRLRSKFNETKLQLDESTISLPNNHLNIFEDSGQPTILNRNRNDILNASNMKIRHSQSTTVETPIYKDNQEFTLTNSIHLDAQANFELKASRNKENKRSVGVLKPESNVGTIPQFDDEGPVTTSKTKFIFNDDLGRNGPIYYINTIVGQKSEKIDCNIKLLHAKTNEEYSVEQLLALSRNVYKKSLKRSNESDLAPIKRSRINHI